MKIKVNCYYILFFLTLSFISVSQVDTISCDKFKYGVFKYKEKAYQNVEIKRIRDKQIERDNSTGLEIIYRIKWINGCKYQLTQLKSNNKNVETLNGITIDVQIIHINSNEYMYMATSKGIVSSYTIIKIK